MAFFAHRNWVGTRRAITNATGTTTNLRQSLPFGDGASNLSGSQDNTYDGFTGLWAGGTSATSHAQYREYWNSAGRWLQPDPYSGSYRLGNPQSFNRYAYALNNPTAFVDRLGRDVCDAGTNDDDGNGGSCGSCDGGDGDGGDGSGGDGSGGDGGDGGPGGPGNPPSCDPSVSSCSPTGNNPVNGCDPTVSSCSDNGNNPVNSCSASPGDGDDGDDGDDSDVANAVGHFAAKAHAAAQSSNCSNTPNNPPPMTPQQQQQAICNALGKVTSTLNKATAGAAIVSGGAWLLSLGPTAPVTAPIAAGAAGFGTGTAIISGINTAIANNVVGCSLSYWGT